jgi:hypothetical protein
MSVLVSMRVKVHDFEGGKEGRGKIWECDVKYCG